MPISLSTLDPKVKWSWTNNFSHRYGPLMATVDKERADFGRRLKLAREKAEMTQTEVGAKFEIGKGTVSAWETGGGLPDAMRLRSLAKMYKVTSDSLLFGGSPPSDEAMQFALQFDALRDDQKRTLRAIWTAFVQDGNPATAIGPLPKSTPRR